VAGIVDTTTNSRLENKGFAIAGFVHRMVAGFDWRKNLITVFFALLLASFFFIGSDGLRTLMYVGMPFLAFYLYQNRASIRLDSMVWYIAFGLGSYFLINYISILWSEPEDAEKLFQRLKMLVIFPLILIPFALKARDRTFLPACLTAYVISAIVTAPLLLLFRLDDILNNQRLFGWGRAENPVQCGLMYGMAFLLIVFYRNKMPLFNKLPRLASYVLSLLPLAALVLSQSRGPFLATAALFVGILALYPVLQNKLCLRKFLLLTALTVSGLLCFLLYGSSVAFERGSTGRLEIWENALELAQEKPLLGHGIATKFQYEFNYNNRVNFIGHPHSIYLSALVHTGIAGFLFQLIAIGSGLYLGFVRYKNNNDASFLIMIGFGALLGFVDFGGYYTNLGTTWLVFWFPLAALLFRPAQSFEDIRP
jgi:O-antigen ligase